MERGYRPRAKLLRTEIDIYTCIEIRARFSLSILKAWCLPLNLELAIGHNSLRNLCVHHEISNSIHESNSN